MSNSLKDMKLGLLFALLTLSVGFLMGANFGAREDEIKAKLAADGNAVLATVYQGDQAKLEKATDKAWAYIKRGHFHGTGIGTAALALIALLAMIQAPLLPKKLTAILLGLGGFGYSLSWTWAGFLLPSLGSGGAARAHLVWLGMPSAAAAVAGVLLATVLIAKDAFSPKNK